MCGFPLPDFGSDGDECLPLLNLVSSNLHALTADEIARLRVERHLRVESDDPIRCTGNSSVYGAVSDLDNQAYALKITQHKRRVTEEYHKRKDLPDRPENRYLVKSIDCFELDSKMVLQMELCVQKDISAHLFTELDTWQLISDIGTALSVLHSQNWMHLDVSPVNILRSNEDFKLADFGTLLQVGTFSEGKEGAGPFVSPEALAYPFGRYPVNTQTDIFSFGLVLVEALTGKYVPRGGYEAYQRIRRGELRFGSEPYRCECTEGMKTLVNAMLAVDPEDRPTAEMLVEIARGRY